MGGLSLLYKKGRPRIGKKKNKVYSLAKRKGDRHVDRKLLDSMFSPVYSVTKKDYGISSVFDDSAATSAELPVSGNLSSLMCQPGRQIYLEFYGLPCRPMPTYNYPNITESSYRRPWSFLELLYGAYKRNGYIVQQSNYIMQPSNTLTDPGLVDPMASGPTTVLNMNENLEAQKTNAATPFETTLVDFVSNVMSNARFNFKFQYMGGHQTHKFQNTTTLPIHVEIREFTPRQPMGYDIRRRDTDASNTYNTWMAPGMWQTLYPDLLRQFNRERDDTKAGGSQYNKTAEYYVDEIDDKMFRYNSGCKDTNFRFVVGPAIKATIYPGEVFTYKMVHPPFSGNSLTWMQNVQRWWKYTARTDGTTYIEEKTVGNTPAFMPGFSKFAMIRMIGSRAFLAPRYQDSDAVVDPDYVTDTNNNAYASAHMPTPANNKDRPILHSATHACRVTHTVTEHHALRTFPTFDARTHIFTDFTANASNTADIVRGDTMQTVDPAELDIENAPE